MSDTNTLQVLRLLYQGLLDCDDDMNLVPWLAARMPEVSADKRTYTFEIKRGVRFANGRELIADDFVYSIERNFEPATRATGTGFLRNIRGSEAFQKARAEDAEREGTDRRRRLAEPIRLEGVRSRRPLHSANRVGATGPGLPLDRDAAVFLPRSA